MNFYYNFSTGALLWAFMYSLFNYTLMLKECIFPTEFEGRLNIPLSIIVFFIQWLFLYPGYLIFSRQANNEPSDERIVAAMLFMVFGLFLNLTSATQKHFTLKAIRASDPTAKPLISEGMWKWTRNPNYLGEIIAFFAFCILAADWTSYGVYTITFILGMVPMMYQKEASIRNKIGSEAYFKRSWLLLPRFCTCWLYNTLIYLNIIAFVFVIYISGGVEKLTKNIAVMLRNGVDWEQVNAKYSSVMLETGVDWEQVSAMYSSVISQVANYTQGGT
jgi:protein-S-isoprenylcysteine O-methyltransferase Ste14